MTFFGLKSHISLFRLLRSGLSPLTKWFIPSDLSFSLIFFCFLMFLLSTCCSIWLFVGFCVSDSNGNATSIRQRSHIKSILVSIIHQTWNLRYFKHIMITSCVGLKLFLLAITLDAMSSFNVFNRLIYVFKCKCITVLKQ